MSDSSDTGWDRGWDEHQQRQLERWAKLPLSEKLDWLEEAEQLVWNLQNSRQQAQQPSPSAPIPKHP